MKNNEIKQELIQKVVSYIEEKNYLPWDKGLLNPEFLPKNAVTGTIYKGFNYMILNFIGTDSTSEYVTFKNIKDKKAKLEKGTKGTPIIFFNWQKWNKTEQRPWKEGDNEKDLKEIPFLKRYYVFPVDKTEGIKKTRELKENKANPRFEEAEKAIQKFIDETGLKVNYRHGTGCYIPATHEINITPINQYKTSEKYYKTFFHELIHSTGKELGRKINNSFGSEKYSEEEIVAEFGAMLLCSKFNIHPPIENSAEYLRSWGKHLLDNPDWLINGANRAEKAAEYFLEVISREEVKVA